MALRVCFGSQRPSVLLLLCALYSILATLASATVILVTNNSTLSFEDVAANFAPEVKASGISGRLCTAEPLDACSTLMNKFKPGGSSSAPFALIIRGGCSFEDKVRRAQDARFKAVIVYDNEDGGGLVAMAGNSAGIKTPAVFVSLASGEKLKKYAGGDAEVWITPNLVNSAWSIMAISFISLLAMSAVLATCFFVRRHRIRRERPEARVHELHGMSGRLVKAMPSLIFTAVLEDNCTASTCAICLEDYRVGDKLRVLPCRHKFHALCVDSWLTTWRTFCPVCKRDARTATGEPPASESTPLLSSSSASVASSILSSSRSSLRSSSAMQIASPSPRSQSASRNHTLLGAPYIPRSQNSYHCSPSMSVSRSSLDIRNMSSRRSPASHLVSPLSVGYPSFSPLNTRYMSAYMPSPSNASSSYLGSSSRPPNPLHCSESAASFSPFASAQSLPGC
ncbi:Receptor y region, transmembrane domain- and RING domain-containing protein 2 [Ancistrocladus abbreviatus]